LLFFFAVFFAVFLLTFFTAFFLPASCRLQPSLLRMLNFDFGDLFAVIEDLDPSKARNRRSNVTRQPSFLAASASR
jgi:hypothetical protein